MNKGLMLLGMLQALESSENGMINPFEDRNTGGEWGLNVQIQYQPKKLKKHQLPGGKRKKRKKM